MCDVEEIERPLAQSLEGWVLQQAVTGLMMAGQLEQAEALCSQVRNEHPRTNEQAQLILLFTLVYDSILNLCNQI